MNYLTQDYQWLICVIASLLVIVDSDDERTPGNCYSVGSVSILAYGVLDAGYRYDLTDKEASVLGRRSIYHTTFRDAGFEGTYYHLKISNIVGLNYSRETILTAKMTSIGIGYDLSASQFSSVV